MAEQSFRKAEVEGSTPSVCAKYIWPGFLLSTFWERTEETLADLLAERKLCHKCGIKNRALLMDPYDHKKWICGSCMELYIED